MLYLYELLSGITNDPHLIGLLFMVMVFLTVLIVFMGLMGVGYGLSDPVSRRLRQVTGDTNQSSSDWSGAITQTLKPFTPYIVPKEGLERGKMKTRLVNAGFRSQNSLTLFYSIKVLGLISALFITTFIGFTFLGFPNHNTFVILAAVAFVSLMLPNKVLNILIEKRHHALRIAFPDALDLLVVCSEAGLGLNAALQRVANELYVSHPILANELMLVNVEVQSGIDRGTALRNLGDRTGLDDINGLVSTLAQSTKYGTSISNTLRVYSDELRDKRMQMAEEKAAKLGTKMTFPLIVCIWPSFFAIAVGPAVIGLMKVFS